MKRWLLFLILVLLCAFIYLKRTEITTFYFSLPSWEYRHFSEANLRRFLAGTEERLAQLEHARKTLSSSARNKDLEKLSAIEEETLYLRRVQRKIQAELQAREDKTTMPFWLHTAVILAPPLALLLALLFLRTWSPRRRIKTSVTKPAPEELPPPAYSEPLAAPFDQRIVKGSTSKQELLRFLGYPDHRTIFTDLEAWSYLYRLPEQNKPEQAPATVQNLKSVIILFRGNTVCDFSEEILLHGKKPSRIY